MVDTVNKILTSGYEVDEVNYQDMMDDELVDQIEHGQVQTGQPDESGITDKAFRTMLEALKSGRLEENSTGSIKDDQYSATDTFENEVMDELKYASIKND